MPDLYIDHKLTTWEAYNHILHGLVNEAIDIFNLDSKVKLTTFQIWSAYLRRNESAFFNDEEEVLPKLPACFHRHDYHLLSRMAKKRKHSEMEATNNDPNGTQFTKFDLQITRLDRKMMKKEQKSLYEQSLILKRVHRTKLSRRYDKQKLGRSILFLIIYCAINYYDPNIQISDILRMIHEGRLSYFECRHFLPANLSEEEKFYINQIYIRCPTYLTHRQFSTSAQEFSFFCNIDLNHANFYVLFDRYVTELALPKTVFKFVERLFSICPIDYEFSSNRSGNIPFYEGRAMGYIIFALKLLFGVNGITELAMSKSAQKLNAFIEQQKISAKKLFVWTEWVEYVTARKLLLMKHYERNYFQNETEYSDYSNQSTSHYLSLHKKNFIYRKKDPALTSGQINKLPRMIKRQLDFANVAQKMKNIKSNPITTIEFPPSLTPNTTNLEVLKSLVDVPNILQEDIQQRDIEYLIKSSKLKKKLRKKGFYLKTTEAPGNNCVSFARNKKKTTKISNFKKNSIKFRWVKTNIDTETYLKNVLNEEEQKEMHKIQAKNDPATSQDMTDLKELTKNYMKEKRKSYKPDDEDFFSEIESSSDSEADENTTITFYKPNFDYWTYLEYPHSVTKDLYDYINTEFPDSFKWLLENCSTIIGLKPYHVYFELLTIETQFLYILKPMYKMKNELLNQDVDKLGTNIRSTVKHLHKRFKDGMLIR